MSVTRPVTRACGRATWLGVLVATAVSVGSVVACGSLPAVHAEGRARATDAASSDAWRWICSQLGTGTAVVTASTITGDDAYPPDWTGPVSGTFVLHGVAPPAVLPGAAVVVDEPALVGSDYRGVVRGHLDLPWSPGRWIINVVRLTPAGPQQAQLQAVAQDDGTFMLDLAAATVSGPGEWGLQVLDASDGYRQEGRTWPQPGVFEGLEVRALVVTDTAYSIGTAPAAADLTFAFPSSRPGAKVFQLVDSASGAVLAEQAPDTGLVRSFDAPEGSPAQGRTHTYDQALALITADSVGDIARASQLARGLLQLQTSGGGNTGGFVSSAAALNPAAALPEYRTGNHSIATYALLRHLRGVPADDPDRPVLRLAATRAIDWLLDRQRAEGPIAGLLTGGSGDTTSAGSFDPWTELAWASTEHNVDAWHTLRLAASVLTGAPEGAAAHRAADRLEAAILATLWNSEEQRFLQGWQPEGPDPTPMLDLDSWGAIFLAKVGRLDLAAHALAHAAAFSTSAPPVVGYSPRLPGAWPVVWFEGTAGVALAQARLGHAALAEATLVALDIGQLPSGAWPESSRGEPALGMSTQPAVAATAWIVLARQGLEGHPTIWDE